MVFFTKGTRIVAAALAATLSLTLTANDAVARPSAAMQSADAVIRNEMSRAIVLRSVRMPDRFGHIILDVDGDAGRIDRTTQVEGFSDADVWVIGLGNWSDIAWLETSPLYTRFAKRLQRADPGARFKSFQWKLGGGRQLDLHFVNLENTAGLSTACLAEMVYTLTRRAVAHRRVADLAMLTPRARPIASVSRDGTKHDNCG